MSKTTAFIQLSPIDVSAEEIVDALDNDEATLQFICELIAHSRSVELRDNLLLRLGVEYFDPIPGDELGRCNATFRPKDWDDEEYTK